jgi:hypothetical protein
MRAGLCTAKLLCERGIRPGIAEQKMYRSGREKEFGPVIVKAMCGSEEFVRRNHGAGTSVSHSHRWNADLSDGGPWVDVDVHVKWPTNPVPTIAARTRDVVSIVRSGLSVWRPCTGTSKADATAPISLDAVLWITQMSACGT